MPAQLLHGKCAGSVHKHVVCVLHRDIQYNQTQTGRLALRLCGQTGSEPAHAAGVAAGIYAPVTIMYGILIEGKVTDALADCPSTSETEALLVPAPPAWLSCSVLAVQGLVATGQGGVRLAKQNHCNLTFNCEILQSYYELLPSTIVWLTNSRAGENDVRFTGALQGRHGIRAAAEAGGAATDGAPRSPSGLPYFQPPIKKNGFAWGFCTFTKSIWKLDG